MPREGPDSARRDRCNRRFFCHHCRTRFSKKEVAMVPLSSLWLPILVSAVFVFIASNVLWMALPFWHRKDYGKLPDEKTVLGALAPAKSGLYIVPCLDWSKATKEQREEMERGPIAMLILRNPGDVSMGKVLVLWFLY